MDLEPDFYLRKIEGFILSGQKLTHVNYRVHFVKKKKNKTGIFNIHTHTHKDHSFACTSSLRVTLPIY